MLLDNDYIIPSTCLHSIAYLTFNERHLYLGMCTINKSNTNHKTNLVN